MTSTALQQRIIERIHKEGLISFAEYMRMALYDPDDGYYVTGRARMGWEGGDYFTSADVSTFFAHALARQLTLWWQKLGEPAPFTVLEQGAGKGNLAQEIVAWARHTTVDFYAALDYQMEDIRTGQDANTPLAVPNTPAPAVILSNELIDAFPVHVVETRNAQLYEVYVDVANGRLCEVLDEPGSAEVAHYLDTYHIPWASFGDGWRAEINLDALHWMQHIASRIRHGYILTIDYGDKAKTLYTHQRQRGTLACYFQHQMNERPLVRPGEQDITAHVNFSALIDEGRRQGFHLHTFTTQRHWLEGLGIHEELEQRHQNEFAVAETERATDRGQIALLQWRNVRQHVATLTDPNGMGNFKVLVLRR
ncbi:MAG: class I SAM-dependent methyltransferase [Ktedonobacteraceae bacterium]